MHKARGLHAADAAPNPAEVAVEAQLGIGAGAVGALLLDERLTLAGEGKIVGAGGERGGRQGFNLRLTQGTKVERLGQFQRRPRTHAQVARQFQQRLLQLIPRNQQRLAVVGQLHLGAQNVHARRGPGVVFVPGQLQQSAGICHSRLRRIHARRRRLRVQVKRGNGAHNQVARIALIHFAGVERQFAGLESAIAFQIDHILLRVNAEIVVGKRPHNFGQPGHRNPEGAQVAVLHIGVALGIHPGKQRGREAAQARALGLFNSRAGHQHAQISLQRLLNRILQAEAIGRHLLASSGGSCNQNGQSKKSNEAKSRFHGSNSPPERAIALQKC